MDSNPRQIALEFSVPASLHLNANQLNTLHHHKRAPLTAALKIIGDAEMRHALRGLKEPGVPYMGRAMATVTVAWPDRVRRDTHNFMAMMKPIVDGFVAAGLLEDDREEFLIGPHIWPADKLHKAPYGKHAMLQWVITEVPARAKF